MPLVMSYQKRQADREAARSRAYAESLSRPPAPPAPPADKYKEIQEKAKGTISALSKALDKTLKRNEAVEEIGGRIRRRKTKNRKSKLRKTKTRKY